MSSAVTQRFQNQGREQPKHDRVATALRDQIAKGQLAPGVRLPTHLVLAKRFGVSALTVQMGLNLLAREGFVTARPRRGTFVMDPLPQANECALVFWNDPANPEHWSKYYMALTNAARLIEHEDRRRFTFFHGVDQHGNTEDRQRLLDLLAARRLAGMIFVNTPMFVAGTPLVQQTAVPRVAVMGAPVYPDLPIVSFSGLFEQALDHFARRGRKRIAILGIESSRAWEPGLNQLLAERGLTLPTYWRQYVSQRQPQDAANCAELLARAPAEARPDALFITDDNLAEYGLAGLVAAGVRVPQELDVITHCNFPWPSASVLPVKRLGYDIRQLLRLCLSVVDRQRRGEPVPAWTKLEAIFEDELQPTLRPAAARVAAVASPAD